jgi:hypothetical protein
LSLPRLRKRLVSHPAHDRVAVTLPPGASKWLGESALCLARVFVGQTGLLLARRV